MSERILIIGSGEHAVEAAKGLMDLGRQVVLNCSGPVCEPIAALASNSACQILEGHQLVAAAGRQGAFSLQLRSIHAAPLPLAVSHIVLAEEAMRIPATLPNAEKTVADRFCPLSRIRRALADNSLSDLLPDGSGSIALLHGLGFESHPAMTAEVLDCALALSRATDARLFVLTGNLKVAGPGLERRYRRCREAGIEILKFSDTMPQCDLTEQGVRLQFVDAATGRRCRLSPALTVVDERPLPDPKVASAAAMLGVELDASGFFQADNVHRLPIFTNRRGVFVTGPCRSVHDKAGQLADLQSLMLAIADNATEPPADVAEIDPAGCARCLTCVRSCPHMAIALADRPRIQPEACQGCGICAASCPAKTILFGPAGTFPAGTAAGDPQIEQSSASVVVFCCSRSVPEISRQAAEAGLTLDETVRLVEVPCGGSVSSDRVMAVLQAGADGVLLITCHNGNCHAGPGPVHAAARIDTVKGSLSAAGLSPQWVAHATTAANMPYEWIARVKAFQTVVRDNTGTVS